MLGTLAHLYRIRSLIRAHCLFLTSLTHTQSWQTWNRFLFSLMIKHQASCRLPLREVEYTSLLYRVLPVATTQVYLPKTISPNIIKTTPEYIPNIVQKLPQFISKNIFLEHLPATSETTCKYTPNPFRLYPRHIPNTSQIRPKRHPNSPEYIPNIVRASSKHHRKTPEYIPNTIRTSSKHPPYTSQASQASQYHPSVI